jgi:hypothetical protein
MPRFDSARAFGIAACAGVAGLACFWLWLADDEETRIAYSRDRQTHRPTPSAAHQRRLNASDPVPSRFYDADEEEAQRVVKSWIDPDWLKSAVDPAIYGTYDMARHPIDGPVRLRAEWLAFYRLPIQCRDVDPYPVEQLACVNDYLNAVVRFKQRRLPSFLIA